MRSPSDEPMLDSAEPARLPGRDYFAFDEVSDEIHRSFISRLAQAQQKVVAAYLPPENVQRFRHGGTWQNPGAENAPEAEMQMHSAFHEIGFDQVVAHDLGMISRMVATITEQMHRQFVEMFYSTIEEGAERVGNSVSGANLAPEEIYYLGLETVQVRAKPDGSIQWPEFRGGGDLPARIAKALETASPEFNERLEALMALKAREAREREAARQGRFLKYGE